MRLPLLLLLLALPALPGGAQVPDPGMAAQQDPGIVQDQEEAREKLLKAADQLDNIESNSEANKAEIESMKTEMAQLQTDNADLKQQMAALQAALDKSEAERAKDRQTLINEVTDLIASKEISHAARHHELADSSPDETTPSTEVHAASDSAGDSSGATGTDDAPAPAPKPQKGYYHVVAEGETLSMICVAYREEGVRVTVAQVRRANGLTSKSVLKVGQKLFIPKPAE